MTALPMGHERRYLTESASVAHVLDAWQPDRAAALCGRTPTWYEPHGWRGSGSHAERERAASLPLCKQCKRRLP